MTQEEKLIDQILEEDEHRSQAMSTPYDPVSGLMSPGTRFTISIPELEPSKIHIPTAMQELPEVRMLMAGSSLTEAFHGSIENARQ